MVASPKYQGGACDTLELVADSAGMVILMQL